VVGGALGAVAFMQNVRVIDGYACEECGRREQPPCGEFIQIERPPCQHGCRDGDEQAEISEADVGFFVVRGERLACVPALAVLFCGRRCGGGRHKGIIACGG